MYLLLSLFMFYLIDEKERFYTPTHTVSIHECVCDCWLEKMPFILIKDETTLTKEEAENAWKVACTWWKILRFGL